MNKKGKEDSRQDEGHFREFLPTVDQRGNRLWIYPARPPGPGRGSKEAFNWYRARILVSLVLLAIMIIVPAWLPYKIRVHDTRDRNVLVDTCSKGLDDLRHFLRDEMGKIDNYSQIHRDIVTTLNEEVENMAWAFRHGGDFMSSDQMSKLQEDISKYKETVKKLRKTKAVSVTPLDANQVINSVLAPK